MTVWVSANTTEFLVHVLFGIELCLVILTFRSQEEDVLVPAFLLLAFTCILVSWSLFRITLVSGKKDVASWRQRHLVISHYRSHYSELFRISLPLTMSLSLVGKIITSPNFFPLFDFTRYLTGHVAVALVILSGVKSSRGKPCSDSIF